MNTTILAFILTTIAGLSTIIGTFIIFVRTNNKNKITPYNTRFPDNGNCYFHSS